MNQGRKLNQSLVSDGAVLDQTGHTGSKPVTSMPLDNDRVKVILGLNSSGNPSGEYCCCQVYYYNMRFLMVSLKYLDTFMKTYSISSLFLTFVVILCNTQFALFLFSILKVLCSSIKWHYFQVLLTSCFQNCPEHFAHKPHMRHLSLVGKFSCLM